MAKTIGNPLSWTAQSLGRAGSHVATGTQRLGSETQAPPDIRKLTAQDLGLALRAGWEDFKACRSDVMFIALMYPVIGLLLIGMATRMELVPLMFPLIMGFALIGPVAAVGVYELSRMREEGRPVHWYSAFRVVERPRFGAILMFGLYLAALLVAWMLAAGMLHDLIMGPGIPASIGAFLASVLGTADGWFLIIIGCGVGALFAVAVLAVSVVTVPLLMDRATGLPVAITTSVRVTRENPRVILGWGVIVGAALVAGAIPFLLGLVVALPVLGHATWHLYRRAVV